jgi:flagellar protein FliO/FliZ
MGMDFIVMMLKVIIFLPCILGLIYISLRYGGTKLQHMQNGRFIKILERVPLSKENSLLVARMGDKGYVVSSSNGKIEILLELEQEELLKIEEGKVIPQYNGLKDLFEKLKDKRCQ